MMVSSLVLLPRSDHIITYSMLLSFLADDQPCRAGTHISFSPAPAAFRPLELAPPLSSTTVEQSIDVPDPGEHGSHVASPCNFLPIPTDPSTTRRYATPRHASVRESNGHAPMPRFLSRPRGASNTRRAMGMDCAGIRSILSTTNRTGRNGYSESNQCSVDVVFARCTWLLDARPHFPTRHAPPGGLSVPPNVADRTVENSQDEMLVDTELTRVAQRLQR